MVAHAAAVLETFAMCGACGGMRVQGSGSWKNCTGLMKGS